MKKERIATQRGSAMIEYVMLSLIGVLTVASLPLPTEYFSTFTAALNPAVGNTLRQPPGVGGGFGGGGLIGAGGTISTRPQGNECPPENRNCRN